MTAQDLKNSILQLAIQGKLVEQRAEEGTAKELIERIKEEKERLIQEGKIKKEKPLPEIAEDEKPFEIPESWEWVRIGDIGSLTRGSGIKRTETIAEGFSCVRYGELYTTYKIQFKNTVSFIGAELYKRCRKVKKGDILMTLTGENKTDIAMAVAYMGEDNIAMGGDMTCWSNHLMEPLYLVYLLNSTYCISCKRKMATGDIIVHISNEKLASILLPIPPLGEQKRIVENIQEVFSYIEKYDKAYSKIEILNMRFPNDMQKSILQYAMQGKLVEQRAEEGTGEDLFRKIKKDRENLVKDGKIRKDKRLESDGKMGEDCPFPIPNSWKWVTLGSILTKLTDGTHKTPQYSANGVKFVSVKDLSSGVLSLDNTKYITEEEHRELYGRCNPERGDMLLSKVGTTGVPAIVDTDEQFSLFVSVALLKYNQQLVCKEFLYYLLQSPLVQRQAAENTRGVGNKNWVLDAIASTLIVLPPYEEQKRIVKELEKVLLYSGRLGNRGERRSES